MPISKAKNLSSLLRSALKSTTKSTTKPSSLTSPVATTTEDRPLKLFVSSVDSKAALLSTSVTNFSHDSPNLKSTETTGDFGVAREELEEDSSSVDATVSSPKSGVLGIPWFSTVSSNNISQLQNEVLPERTHRSKKLVNLCANKLGTDATLNVFGRLGRETGVKEYNSLIKSFIERAQDCDHEDVALEQICKAFQLLNFMKEQGFQLGEETYGPLLMYLIDTSMIEAFHFFRRAIESGNSRSDPRLGYYEMLLWIRVNDEEKIQELCNCTTIDYEGDYFNLIENYLLALCESKRNSEFLQLLETVDITKVSSLDHVMSIFKFLGRLVLESFAEKYLLALKISDYGAETSHESSSIPNLEVEDIISKFRDLHAKLEIKPSSASYEKLIAYTWDVYGAYATFDIVDKMSEAGLTPSIDTLNSLLTNCHSARRVYLMICHHNLKPNSETFRCMISLSVKMEDFDGAYAMLCDEKKMNLMLTADMYNAIMNGYFQQKDMTSALKVLKEMEKADVKPNSQTFIYLIENCSNEKDIAKYYEEMTCSGVQVTKQVFMALITAYASCGEFEKAKQVILDKGIPVESLNEIKESLVVALASNGQMFDALVIYEEIKQVGWRLKPEAVLALIDHLHSEEELSRSIQLLEELDDYDYWMDGCCSVILDSVHFKSLSFAVPLLKQLKDKTETDRFILHNFLVKLFFLIAVSELPDLQFSLDLLRIMKNELDLSLSAECLDFLLSVCVKEKNLEISRLIWKEYETAGLPYNLYSCLWEKYETHDTSLSCLWMYRALLVSGDRQGARKMLSRIPKDDPKICMLIRSEHENWLNPEHYWCPRFGFGISVLERVGSDFGTGVSVTCCESAGGGVTCF